MKKISKKKIKPTKKSHAPKKTIPKPRKTKPTPTPKPTQPAEEEFVEEFTEPETSPSARVALSDFPDRALIEKFAASGNPALPADAQLSLLEKCDPEHPRYDKLFAECTLGQARNESGTTKTTVAQASLASRDKMERPYKVEMEGEYDPASYIQEGDTFALFKQSAGFSLYASKGEPKVYRIVDAATRYVTPHTKIEGGKTSFLPPPDQEEWDAI